jgi:hypothetical protein
MEALNRTQYPSLRAEGEAIQAPSQRRHFWIATALRASQ